MATVAEKLSNFVIVTSDNPRNENLKKIISEIIIGFKKNNYKITLNREEAIKDAINMMSKNHILIILGKGRENYELIKNKKIYHSDVNIIKSFA